MSRAAELAKGSVGLSGVTGQSLSAMGLSGVIGTSVPIIAITAGAGGWLTWALAAVVILLVALSIAVLARRYATTGGLYGLAAKALGPLSGLTTGWLMIVLCGLPIAATVLSCGVYFSQFFVLFHISYGRPTLLVTSVLALGVAWWMSRIGARPAAWVMFAAEIVTTVGMLVVFIAVLVTNRRSDLDTAQLHLRGASTAVIVTAIVLAVGSFGGFESATVYGREARNPRKIIPIAMVVTVSLAGVLWMFSGYVMYLGFQHSTASLAKSAAPMATLAQISGIGWYSYVIDLALSFTLGASLIAAFSWIARMMLTMSRERVAPRRWRTIHPRYQTPSFSLNLAGSIWLVLVVVMAATSSTPLATFGDYAADLSGYTYLLVYALISLAAAIYVWRKTKWGSLFVAIGFIGAGAMGYVFYRSIVPWPPFPDSLTLIGFLVATAVVMAGYFLARARGNALDRIGTTVDEDTISAAHQDGEGLESVGEPHSNPPARA